MSDTLNSWERFNHQGTKKNCFWKIDWNKFTDKLANDVSVPISILKLSEVTLLMFSGGFIRANSDLISKVRCMSRYVKMGCSW